MLGPRTSSAAARHSSITGLPRWLHDTRRRSVTIVQAAAEHSPEEVALLRANVGNSPVSPDGPQAAAATELSEAEAARRKRISQANSGRVPWNKGRKHSPETIAKIKAKTEEAMNRPEIKQNFKLAMEKRQQVHSDETKAKISAKVRAHMEQKRISEGKPPKSEEVKARKPRKSRARAADADAAASGSPEAAGEEVPKKTTSRSRKPKQADANEDSPLAAPTERKRRIQNSEAHKQAIREAMKAKWEDPAHREYMRQRMQESAKARAASTPPADTAGERKASGSKTSSGSGSGSSSTSSESRQQQQMWLLQIQSMVNKLHTSQELLETLDQKVKEMQAMEGALMNDPVMRKKLAGLMQQIEANRLELSERVATEQAKIPPNVGLDDAGRVFLKRHPAPAGRGAEKRTADGSASSTAAAGPGEDMLGLSSEMRHVPEEVEAPIGTIDVSWDLVGSTELREAVGRSL